MTVPAPDVSPACACVPVQELDDDAVGVAYLKRAFAPLLGPQWHRDGDAFGLQPGHFGLQVVHFEGEDEPGGVIVALVFGQHVHTAAQEHHVPVSGRASEMKPSADISSVNPKCPVRNRAEAATSSTFSDTAEALIFMATPGS